MNRADVHAAESARSVVGREHREVAADPELHLFRRLLGERERDDGVLRHVVDANLPGDPARRHLSLARAGTGDYQETTRVRLDRARLRRREAVEKELAEG